MFLPFTKRKPNGSLPGNGVYEQIDNLAYTYSGEHLTNVTDNTTSNTARPFGFRPDASGYTCDDNDNLKKDTGKNLNIRYNVLNFSLVRCSTSSPSGVLRRRSSVFLIWNKQDTTPRPQ